MRANLFIKVEVDYDGNEPPEKLAEQICRQIRKIYGVRKAELSHVTDETR
jgi:hypothetical protein